MYPLPTHAYVPGINERHPENAFDDIKQSVKTNQQIQQLEQCAAFRAGLQFFEAGFYWETHEVLEPVWMALPDDCIEKRFIQGLIQLANGRLKLRMNRPNAAARLVVIARELIPKDSTEIVMTLAAGTVIDWVDQLEKDIKLAI